MKDTIEMARDAEIEVTFEYKDGDLEWGCSTAQLKAFEALVRADEREACAKVCDEARAARLAEQAKLVAAHERNKLAAWMIQFGFATGHGDTMEELVDELGTEIVDRIDGEVEAEREACAKVADYYATGMERNYSEIIADAIRARGETK
jgi:hypothetical protein